ncbi:MAG: hypothetical protein M3467_07480 [Actinomycetota bacterium]|nr:hypothetical protein [Actinomycetota bacterium]
MKRETGVDRTELPHAYVEAVDGPGARQMAFTVCAVCGRDLDEALHRNELRETAAEPMVTEKGS